MRLLIVEDDRELREALAALLRQAGYEVDAYADGRDAFNNLLASEYDLAIVDLMLPGMNGLALVRNLRRQLVGLPILIVTARDALEAVPKAHGATVYAKPLGRPLRRQLHYRGFAGHLGGSWQ